MSDRKFRNPSDYLPIIEAKHREMLAQQSALSQAAGNIKFITRNRNFAVSRQPVPKNSARTWFFGHSLVDNVVANSQVGSAMNAIATAAGQTACADGTFTPDLSPTIFNGFPQPWENSMNHTPGCFDTSWENTDYDTVVITENNFTWKSPATGTTDAAVTLINQIHATESNAQIHLYEHWPEFDFGTNYATWLNSEYLDYADRYEEMQDDFNANEATANVRLIPVGRIFAQLVRSGGMLDTLTESDLFIDTAPHGTPTTYFIAGLIHYMSIFRQQPPADYAVPSYVNDTVANNFSRIVEFSWNQLTTITDASGSNRVFGSDFV